MYRRIVARKLQAVFDALHRGQPAAIRQALTPSAVHFFIGRHALGGTRRTPEPIAHWYAPLLRLLPGIRFDIERIDIAGPPWRILAVVRWHESNSGTDGVRTRNAGVNPIELAWGRVRAVRILADTAVLQRTLDRLAAIGVAEAGAAPVES